MSTGTSKAVDPATLTLRQTAVSILIIAGLFFIFGFVSWVNAILIPYFKIACELETQFESYLVAFAFYISYFVMSLPASWLLRRAGFRTGMMIGLLIMSAGAFVFVPAAWWRSYPMFLSGLFTIGTGLAILQTAANPYITILGAREKAAQRLSIMGICNKGAGILAPLVFAAVILRATDTGLFQSLPDLSAAERSAALDELIRRVMAPYTVVGIVLMLLALMIRLSPLPEIDTESESEQEADENRSRSSVLAFPHLVFGALAIFFHVGTQVISIDTVIGYAAGMGLDMDAAKIFPSFTLTATIAGYLIGISLIPKVISQRTALRICTVLGLMLSLLIVSTSGEVDWLGLKAEVSIWFVVLLGLANSLVWAGIWPLALEGLGRYTKTGASLLIMGLCGNALMPLLYGWLADRTDLQTAYVILIPCYLYLTWYAVHGHRLRRWTVSPRPA